MDSRRLLACASVAFILGVAACRSGDSAAGNLADGSAEGGGAGSDYFDWSEGGKVTRGISEKYDVEASPDGSSFVVFIRGIAALGATCFLNGRFAAAAPPATGDYPIAPILDGTTEIPLPDGSFGLSCQPSALSDGGYVLDPGVSGQVAITFSSEGRLAGSFTAEAAQLRTSGSPTTTFNGRFSVHCADDGASNTGCGPFSASTVGTCADLLACCAAADAAVRDTCMSDYSNAAPGGDVACGRLLAVSKSFYCP